MTKSLKRTGKRLLIVLLLIALGCAISIALFFGGIGIRIYHNKYIECNPEELLRTLEWVFDVSFPTDIREVKAAKTPRHDRSILFVVRFSAEPDTVSRFLESVAEKNGCEPYERRYTFTTNGWLSPRWARKPIKQGSKCTLPSVRGAVRTTAHTYVDMEDKKAFLVYIQGLYPVDSMAQKL